MWYSFTVGPVHFVSVSSETDYPGAPSDFRRKRGIDGESYPQLDFIQNDLAAVDRSKTPFVVVYMHRPMYVQGKHLEHQGDPIGQPAKIQAAFENLFASHRVDLLIAGHTHMYQRTLPTLHNQVNETHGIVSLVVGGAGGLEGLTKYARADPSVPWIAMEYNATESFATMEANMTHLYIEAFSSPADLSPSHKIDEVVIKARTSQ